MANQARTQQSAEATADIAHLNCLVIGHAGRR